MSETARITACFHGYVQGVGFRATTEQIATRQPVTGFVRNERDGTVWLELEGPREAIQAVLDKLQQTMAANIERADIHWTDPVGTDDCFRIRHH